MTAHSVRSILGGQAPAGQPVTVRGWVRTRRDSKAGLSFVHVSDGSSFHPVQVVVPATMSNYASEVQKLTAGCAVEATGTIVPSPAKGQPFEMQATGLKVVGWVDDPDTYPIQPPSSRPPTPRARASSSAFPRSTSRTCRARPTARSISPAISSAAKPSSR